MAMMYIFQGLSLLLLTMLCPCLYGSHDVIDAHFKIYHCAQPELQTILRVIPVNTTSASSVVHCAISCHRTAFCKYAIFNNRNKTCEEIYGLTNTFQSIIHDINATDTNCKVLAKIMTERWTPIKFSELMILKDYVDFSEFKHGRQSSDKIQVFWISQLVVDESKGFTMATLGKTMAVDFNTNSFPDPCKNRLFVWFGDFSLMKVLASTINIWDGKKEVLQNKWDTEKTIVWKHVKLESDARLANNFDEVLFELQQGSRRMERHPATIIIDSNMREIHFDMTETTQIVPPGNIPSNPLKFQSIKEVYGENQNDTRYVLKHHMFKNIEQPYETSKINNSYPWVFETTWKRIDGPDDLQQIENAVRQGKPLRIFLNDEIYSDINMVYVTPDNIMVSMTPYIYPFKGQESQSVGTHYIQFPQFQTSNSTLIECQSSDISGKDLHLVSEMNSSTATWFVSTKTWTKLLVMDKDKTVLFGSANHLNDSIFGLKNIRVCVEETFQIIYCFSTQFASSLVDKTSSLLQSDPLINPMKTFSEDPIACRRQQMMMISSKGWLKRIIFNAGSKVFVQDSVLFEKIYWFEEQD